MLNKNKGGQITIFIIISILIVSVVALFFTLRGNLNLPGKPVSPETAEIQNFVQECLDETSEFAVFDIAEKGGYEDPSKVSSTIVFNTPYYLKNNKNLMPSKEDIENEISKHILKQMDFCINNFASFPEYEITDGKMIVEEKIQSEKVLVEMNYPLTIIKGDSKSKLEDFNSEVPVRFGIVYDAILEFITQSINSKGVCINCLLEISSKNNLKSEFSNYNNKTAIFIINDPQSKLGDKEFVYIFANEY
ncbi:hypothetical protein HYT91_03080 [Candidatus Pacearchaeota archaeon]|nr:hypothetical protein [Candidatus Pacearchaeota archaeon]